MDGDYTTLFFDYHFKIANGEEINYRIDLDLKTLAFKPSKPIPPEPWMELDHHICDDCPLQAQGIAQCPVAVNLGDLVKGFGAFDSFQVSDVEVHTAERSISRKEVAVQQGLSSILGIVMVTSNCPDLDYLRPMVRLHLPFSSIEETTIRATSMYLLAQFTRARNDQEPDWSMRGLTSIYQRIDHINRRMVKRLQSASDKDASLNAVVILDTFAQMVPLSVEGTLKGDLEHLFWPYLHPGEQGPRS